MRIAITADAHLNEKHPERFEALEDVVEKVKSKKIQNLIIAGDLFDQNYSNHAKFNKLCANNEQITFLILPGNHDEKLKQQQFSAKNIKVFSEATIHQFNDSTYKFLFVPYKSNTKMVDGIIKKISGLEGNEWFLISHGDCREGIKEFNPYEPGTYMPIISYDIEKYKPIKVILGHIHKRSEQGKVHYVGSPCGIDISETGYRKFSILDLENIQDKRRFITESKIATKHIFCDGSLLVTPLDKDGDIKERINNIIQEYGIAETDRHKIIIRLKVRGHYPNLEHLNKLIKEKLSDYKFYDESPNLDDVNTLDKIDPVLKKIAEEALEKLHHLKLNVDKNSLSSQDITVHIMETVFGNGYKN